MDFALNDTQAALKEALTRFLAARYDFETRRKIIRSEAGWSAEVWQALAIDMGLCGAAIPEDAGGQGGGAVEIMLAMDALGAAQVIEPVLESLALAPILLAGTPLLADVAGGAARIAFAWMAPETRYASAPATRAERTASGWRLTGVKTGVVGGQIATHVIVSAKGDDGPALFVLPSSSFGDAVRPYRTIDDRLACDLRCDGLDVPATALIVSGAEATARIEKSVDAGAAGICAEAVGALRVLLDDTVAYSKQRQQFGQPIGQFQALQHRMVDMHLALEQANAAAHLAALKLDATPQQRQRAVSAAKLAINSAARMIGQNAVQLHGGMGMTDELRIGHYFKRLTVIEAAFGDTDFHTARYAQARA